jgi:hypothetical protein
LHTSNPVITYGKLLWSFDPENPTTELGLPKNTEFRIMFCSSESWGAPFDFESLIALARAKTPLNLVKQDMHHNAPNKEEIVYEKKNRRNNRNTCEKFFQQTSQGKCKEHNNYSQFGGCRGY